MGYVPSNAGTAAPEYNRYRQHRRGDACGGGAEPREIQSLDEGELDAGPDGAIFGPRVNRHIAAAVVEATDN